MNFMAWLAQRWANIVHPTDNHTPTVRLNANVGPTLSCYLGMTSSFDIVSPSRIRGGIRKVSGGTTAGPRRIRGGIRVSRGGIESGQVRGSAGGGGGLEKLSTGVSGLVKKTLDCTVCNRV